METGLTDVSLVSPKEIMTALSLPRCDGHHRKAEEHGGWNTDVCQKDLSSNPGLGHLLAL